MLLLRFAGSLLLRNAARRFDALLLKLPPRITRLVASPSNAARPGRAPGRRTLAHLGRPDPASQHAADLIALLGEVEVLGLGDAAEISGEAHQDAGADQRAGGGGQRGLLVAAVGCVKELRQDVDAGLVLLLGPQLLSAPGPPN
jgi:hypothetical protein